MSLRIPAVRLAAALAVVVAGMVVLIVAQAASPRNGTGLVPGPAGTAAAPGASPVPPAAGTATSGGTGSGAPAGSAPLGSAATQTSGAAASAPAVAPSSSAPAESPATPAQTASPEPSAATSPLPTPAASPVPTLVPAPLTGLMVTPAVAARHVIAVMIDDLSPARPQSGFSDAGVVWQAPAEGGIPRYMLLFQDGVPADVGPIRSARYYFIGWAAEWRAAYVHAGGSPQALHALRYQGRGQLVYNVEEFAWGKPFFWRITTRFAPHNLYTNGERLRQLADRVGAGPAAAPPPPAWRFRPAAALADRPTGGSIEAWYLANHIRYTYDRTTNTWPRWVSPGVAQVDASTGRRVAPTNVVIMFVQFGPLNDSHPDKGRLEAEFIGSGKAIVAINGRSVSARWTKTSLTSPTMFTDTTGRPIALTPGQTFVQVMPVGAHVVIAHGSTP